MLLYNVSVMIDDSRHDTVIGWIKLQLQECPYKISFLKMLDSPHDGSTYCIQLLADEDAIILQFQKDVVAVIQEYINSHHAEKAFIFDSKMRYLSL